MNRRFLSLVRFYIATTHVRNYRSFGGCLIAGICGVLMAGTSIAATDAQWQTLKEGTNRIQNEQKKHVETALPVNVPLPQGHYELGQGAIEGAFGVSFNDPLPTGSVAQDLGWREPPNLPNDLAYRGLVTPLTIQLIKVTPPNQPPQLQSQNTRYQAWVDFDQKPMRIETDAFSNADSVLDIIERKYGEPDEIDGQKSTYIRGVRRLHILRKKNTNSASLVYEDMDVYANYLAERNRSLKRKFRNDEVTRLSPQEHNVVRLARQLETFRQGSGEAFGLPFGRRVGFKAAPDEFVDFDPPRPITAFAKGQYKIMVSPDLMPVAIRYELNGKAALLSLTKQRMELAMELAFAGFLKQTPKHTVLSFNQHAYSLLIRNNTFQFTIHDRAENSQRNEREKLAKIAAADAKAEQERLAELERQRLAIAARQKEIAEENAF